MHANVTSDRGGGSGGGSWRLPPDETLQVSDPKEKLDELDYGETHNWKSIIFSLLVIGFVIAGIVTAIYLLGYVDELLYWSGRRMLLDEYLQNDLSPNRLQPTWVSRTKFVFQSDDGGLAVYETTNNSVKTLVTNHTLRQLNIKGYHCSTNLEFVLFKHNVKSVFRKSFTAFYTVYDVTKDHHMPVRLKASLKVQRTRLQYAAWLGNTTSLVIVVDNDIYLKQSPSDEDDIRITNTGKIDLIYNGVPDWLYQEEIFTTPEAIWSSDDGSHLMYVEFNDTQVGTMVYPWFDSGAVMAVHSFGSTSFPESRTVRYPTPGSKNPEVKLWIVDISNTSTIHQYPVTPPITLDGQEVYITSAGWVAGTNHNISVVWMNRAQNKSVISTCSEPDWKCIETHSERAPEDEWLDILPHPIFSPDGDSFLMLASIQETGTEHFTHIKHVTITQQRISVISHGRYEQVAVITNGRHQVLKILAWDTKNHLVYYLGTQDRKPGQQHMYVVKDPLNKDIGKMEPQCITCDIENTLWSSRRLYRNCSYFDVYLSPLSSIATDYRVEHYVLECQGPTLPVAGVHSIKTNILLQELYNTANSTLRQRLDKLALPKKHSFEITLQHGTRAQVQILYPPSWREELRDAAFPVLVEVNGRPGASSITEKFQIDWGTYMSSRNDVIYIRLDVRGSKGQSKQALYRHLGGAEVEDQIDALSHLLSNMNYLDETRVGIWGWGYGGYVTAMVLGAQQPVYKCGVSVSPITDWLFYNSAFTERILGLPNENYKGYVEADATQRARHIPSHSFFLLHGLADSSAPYLHGTQLARALAKAGVIFQYQTYADEGHELSNVLEHVYKSMEHYLKDCLSLDPDDEKTEADSSA
ncbi:inactive dipeptidyl peptidase 10 isoform X1 [Contarinia nasturtii]|uniref:inactive dipeptidyl peptidase 10 isoform X1 n=1 Tax=Contarinia nasturtii TaxID=265458 RepID=UPI0012D3812C|nr:inactive dipeptidyl peptidase 10 isoform X1 [Contarinia nasturtii]XP_031617318.1 inactive dipeptidyl peptidase 10 isoform X1 [Contarinia nasturtii]XP_031617319.1 inactive dipeptidyl peptidase 10 isoform X1 [Contarinia nasturtii]XP_031617320.1 inactive dipeptidyl peptidase 10 isoform X1 [Contarinia nasturtii]XP_031617321.1 inactive dipeptidyl peptidase 10 isoform X1 [Contarinia nasturtii]